MSGPGVLRLGDEGDVVAALRDRLAAAGLLDQDVARLESFRRAGFEALPVEAGLLYELVPPGREH